MAENKIPGGPLWMHWTRTVACLLLFAEYMRLILTTDVAQYRKVVAVLLGVVLIFSLVSLVRAIRYKKKRIGN